MKKLLPYTLIFVSHVTAADVPSGQAAEVKHLLDFVKNSGCIINRNGSDHPAEEAFLFLAYSQTDIER